MNLEQARAITQDLPDEFFLRLVQVAKRVQCDPVDLLRVMTMESGIRRSTRNKESGAVGILQFTPISNKATGLTELERRALGSVSETRQLDYVERYFLSIRKDFGVRGPLSRVGVYQAVFCPRSLRSSDGDDAICYRYPSKEWDQNSGLVRQEQRDILVRDLKPFVEKADAVQRFQAARARLLALVGGQAPASGNKGEGLGVVALALVGGSIFFALWKAKLLWN